LDGKSFSGRFYGFLSLRELGQAHLRAWVEEAGEEEVQHRDYGKILPQYKWPPLTIDDYFQKMDPEEEEQLQIQ
jgi:hypothetical protein